MRTGNLFSTPNFIIIEVQEDVMGVAKTSWNIREKRINFALKPEADGTTWKTYVEKVAITI
jgi:hypothetical protein